MYSEELQKQTENVLDQGILNHFVDWGYCHMKNSDGRFGSIHIKSVMQRKYNVEERDSDKVYSYDTLDALINDGWVID